MNALKVLEAHADAVSMSNSTRRPTPDGKSIPRWVDVHRVNEDRSIDGIVDGNIEHVTLERLERWMHGGTRFLVRGEEVRA